LTWGFGALAAVTLPVSLYLAFLYAPTEREMGEVQRIFYYHVSSAYCAFIGFLFVCICGGFYLATRRLLWDRVAHTGAEVGMVFCSLVLITGPLWARPVWNTWWTWDPRLTTTLILWLIYAGYLILRTDLVEVSQVERFAAVYGIVGFLDVPVVYMSIRWWRTIHPLVFNTDGSMVLDPAMHFTLHFTFWSFAFLFFFLSGMRLCSRLMTDELEALKLARDLRTV
jgi:heme exporter protein C